MKSLRSIFALCLLLTLPALAHAQMTLTLDNPNQFGNSGDTLAFSGTLNNPTTSLIFLTGSSFNFEGIWLTLDDSPFDNAPLSLDAGQSFTGLLFNVSIASGAPSQYAPGTFRIQGGTTEGDLNDIAAAQFTVTANAPEPASGLLALGALFALGMTSRCRGFRHLRGHD